MKQEHFTDLLNIPDLPAYMMRTQNMIEDTVLAGNSTLHSASSRLIKSSGKRLRPIFVIAAASSQGGVIDDTVIASCAAIELVHIGTLVHDDIIDEADVRRGVPTVSAVEGANAAILVGDYLLALGSAKAVTVNKEVAYTVASTVAEMCIGQSQESDDNYNTERSIDSYLATIHKKTATLLSAACRVGAICAGLSDKEVEAFAKYGEAFGMAFQIADDLLDLISTTEALGKPVGNDIKEGVYTLPLLIASKGSKEKIKVLLGEGPNSHAKHEAIVAILLRDGALEMTLARIREYNAIAANSLRIFDQTNVIKGLSELPEIYLEWVLKKQTVLHDDVSANPI